jgi:hypothetical protein
MKNQRFRHLAVLAAGLALSLSLAACGDNGEPSQQDLQTALSASNELPDPTVQVEKMRCETAPDDKQAWLCEYRFPPADPLKGIFKKSAGVWRHVGPAPAGATVQ